MCSTASSFPYLLFMPSFQLDHLLSSEGSLGPGRALRTDKNKPVAKAAVGNEPPLIQLDFYHNSGNCLLYRAPTSSVPAFPYYDHNPYSSFSSRFMYLSGSPYCPPILMGFVQQSSLLPYIVEWPKPHGFHSWICYSSRLHLVNVSFRAKT